MTDESINITSRPFLSDLTADGAPTHARPQQPSQGHPAQGAAGHSHLFAAATGAHTAPAVTQHAPALRAVEPEEPESFGDVEMGTVREPAYLDSYFQTPLPGSGEPPIAELGSGHPATGDYNNLDIDWDLVRRDVLALDLKKTVSRSRESFDVASAGAAPETEEEQLAWDQITTLVIGHSEKAVLTNGESFEWPIEKRSAHSQAVFDEAFRYGRLSPLLREDVENVDIWGAKKVWVTMPNGDRQPRGPVAIDDAGVEALAARVATDRGRVFARPHGSLRLDIGGARFTALGGPSITPVPRIAIRKHRMVDVSMVDIVNSRTLTPRMAAFLGATMSSFCSHLVSGFPASGKTTFMRALAASLDPREPIVTIETERELYLDKLELQHYFVDPLQYLPDTNSGDDRTAAFDLNDAIEQALRLNAQVILFGEILGPVEAVSAIKALQAGKGASSTIHAESAYDAIQRFADLLVTASGLTDDAVPQRQIMRAIDFIVQLKLLPKTATEPQRRVVSEISEIIPGDAPNGHQQLPITRPIFVWDDELQTHIFVEEPSPKIVERLVLGGFLDPDFFQERRA